MTAAYRDEDENKGSLWKAAQAADREGWAICLICLIVHLGISEIRGIHEIAAGTGIPASWWRYVCADGIRRTSAQP